MDDINALLNDAEEQIEAVEDLHDVALTDPITLQRFKTRIKNVLEAQRSALDYLAVGLTETFGKPKGLIYFPLAQAADEFPDVMDRHMPGVATARKEIAVAIEKHQPYHPNMDSLRHLNQLT